VSLVVSLKPVAYVLYICDIIYNINIFTLFATVIWAWSRTAKDWKKKRLYRTRWVPPL